MRKRDSQRARVYAAEREHYRVHGYGPTLTEAEAKAMVYAMLYHQGVWDKEPRGYVQVQAVPRIVRSRASGTPYGVAWIWLSPKYGLNVSTVCHEAAHLVALNDRHGARFCAAHLRLVRHFWGPMQAGHLLDCYRKHKVRVNH